MVSLFSSLSHLSPSSFIPDTTLPPNTYISGKLSSINTPTDRLTLGIITHSEESRPRGDYDPLIAPKTSRYAIKVVLHPSPSMGKGDSGVNNKENLTTMFEMVKRHVGREVMLSSASYSVISVSLDGRPNRYNVELHGYGRQVIQPKGKPEMELFKEIISEPTPIWFNTPSTQNTTVPTQPHVSSPQPSEHEAPDQPIQLPRNSPEAVPGPSGPSRYRPLSEHALPPLPPLPQFEPKGSGMKRGRSWDGKALVLPVPVKRARIDDRPPGPSRRPVAGQPAEAPGSPLEVDLDKLNTKVVVQGEIALDVDLAIGSSSVNPDDKLDAIELTKGVEILSTSPHSALIHPTPLPAIRFPKEPCIVESNELLSILHLASPSVTQNHDYTSTPLDLSIPPTLPLPLEQTTPLHLPSTRTTSSIPTQTPTKSSSTRSPLRVSLKARSTSSETRPSTNREIEKDGSSPSYNTSGLKRKSMTAYNPSLPDHTEGHIQGKGKGKVGSDVVRDRRKVLEEKAREEARSKIRRQEEVVAASKSVLDGLTGALRVEEYIYTPLIDIKQSHQTNILGIVISTIPPRRMNGGRGDWLTSIIITDVSRWSEDRANEDLVVGIFRKELEGLPKVEMGQAILFRGLTISHYNGKPKGNAYSADQNSWAYLSKTPTGATNVVSDRNLFPPLSEAEIMRLKRLEKWWADAQSGRIEVPQVQQGVPRVESNDGFAYVDEKRPIRSRESLGQISALGLGGGNGGKATMLLGDVRENTFFNGVFKIIHVAEGRKMELYITDGSFNPSSTISNRNFHGIKSPYPALSIFCLAIHSSLPASERQILRQGNIVVMNNIRSKIYKHEMELSWSELVSDDQERAGVKRARLALVGKSDERALVIEQRLKALENGEIPHTSKSETDRRVSGLIMSEQPTSNSTKPTMTRRSSLSTPLKPINLSPKPKSIRLATHLKSIYNDPINHPLSYIAEVNKNQTFPNKYKVLARVCEIWPRIMGGDYILKYCRHCKRSYQTDCCLSCNDIGLLKTEWRYWLCVLLEDESGDQMLATLSGEEANAFLPPLPPATSTQNPNDVKKTKIQLKGCMNTALDILQGAKMDDERALPFIEWGLVTYLIKAKGKEIVVASIRGMRVG